LAPASQPTVVHVVQDQPLVVRPGAARTVTSIVTYAHRPKRPARKRAKAAAIEAPAIVREGRKADE
jgi:hypothetical protein